MTSRIQQAVDALRRGQVVLVYDAPGREGETDLVVASEFVTPEIVRTLRTDGGGLICTTLSPDTWKVFGLPLMADVISSSTARFPSLEGLVPTALPYDRRSSFSLAVNHVDTRTGITDRDRATTISRIAEIVAKNRAASNGWAQEAFREGFRAPGHVPLLNAAAGLLHERRGHTELVTALVLMADLTPTATICEMLAPDGKALGWEDAKAYARRHDTVFLQGEEIVEAWDQWSG